DAADNLLLLRTSKRVVVIPDQLHYGIVGFRSRINEKDFGHRDRRDTEKFLRQFDADIVRLVREGVIEGQLEHLLVGRLGQSTLGKSEARAPQAPPSLPTA